MVWNNCTQLSLIFPVVFSDIKMFMIEALELSEDFFLLSFHEVTLSGGQECWKYGGSQARGQIGATAASLHQSHSNTRSKQSLTYTTAHGNTRSLTHWARPGI